MAHHSNIKSKEFGPEYFRRFTIVMNALDNLDARRHVNRVCIACNIPLIESGTEGCLGQVQVIKKVSLFGSPTCIEKILYLRELRSAMNANLSQRQRLMLIVQ